MVVVGYVLNDPETEPIQPLSSYFQEPAAWQRSNLARLVAQAKHSFEVDIWGDGDYYNYLHSEKQEKWNSVVSAFEDIRNLTESQEIPVLVVIFPERPNGLWSDYACADIHRQVAEISHEMGFSVIDLLDRFSQYPARSVRVRRRDSHPSPLGHEVAAEAIHEWIASELPEAAVSYLRATPSS